MTEATTTHDETSPSTEPQSASPQIPKDLQDQWGAVQACATAANVMKNGSFTTDYMEAVRASLHFLVKLHEQSVEACLKHPDAKLIPQLTKLKEAMEKRERKAQKKAEQNGEEETEH